MDEEKSPFLEEGAGDGGSDTDDEILYSKHVKSYSCTKKLFFAAILAGVLVLSLLVVLLLGIGIGRYTQSSSTNNIDLPPTVPPPGDDTQSNAPHSVADDICSNPPLLLISLDGFWNGYLERDYTPFIKSLAANGVRAEYMQSEFPTETFPNHFSIVTGLHPESHGIVSNYFYDTVMKEKFYMTQSDVKTKPEWWLGEPVWVTAAKSSLKSAVYAWPASDVDFDGIRPSIYYPYDKSSFEERVTTVLNWLQLPSSQRPQLMVAYFEQPDIAGHEGGPNSQKVNDMLTSLDQTVESLFAGLKERGVEECVNVIIVSDHGMAPFDSKSVVHLKKLLPAESLDDVHIEDGVVSELYVTNEANRDEVVKKIYSALVQNGTKAGLPFRVYLRGDLPLRLHAGHFNKQRYGDIYLISDEGSALQFEDDPQTNVTFGNHGYDNILTNVQAIFIAHGPAFKKGYVADGFANIQLYNLMCGLLGITPAPNNGTAGALNHILTPSLLTTLPPPQVFQGRPGVHDSCPYPTDQLTYNTRSFCPECVCSSNGKCADVSNNTMDDSNLLLNLNTDEMTNSQVFHLPWGVPDGGEGLSSCLLTQQDYVTLYSKVLHVPLWSAFKLTGKQASLPPSSGGCLRRDPRLSPSHSSNCSDYTSTEGEGGGEFVPVRLTAALSTSSPPHQLTTNLLSNVIPQLENFNEGVWQPLEKLLRSWAVNFTTIHVILGSVFDTDRDGEPDNYTEYTHRVGGDRGVAIPTHFYAVVVRCINDGGLDPSDCDPDQLDATVMLFQHPTEPGDPSPLLKLFRFSLTPIRDIERLTGVNFFPDLTPQQQNTLELTLNNKLWTTL